MPQGDSCNLSGLVGDCQLQEVTTVRPGPLSPVLAQPCTLPGEGPRPYRVTFPLRGDGDKACYKRTSLLILFIQIKKKKKKSTPPAATRLWPLPELRGILCLCVLRRQAEMGGEGLPSNLRFSSPSPEWAPKRKRGQEREGQGEDTETGQETGEGPGGLWGKWPPPCSPMPTRLSLSAWPLTPDTAPTPKEQAHPSRACWPA